MFISPTEALKQYKISKPTLYKDMEKGKLSFKLDDRGKRKINIAELDRIYDKKQDDNDTSLTSSNVKNISNKTLSDAIENSKDVEIQYLKKLIATHENETENLRDALKLSQEGHNRTTLLLEDKSDGAGGFEKGLKALEARITNQEKTAKDLQEKKDKILRQNLLLKRALKAERSKKWYQKLFA
ncbi:hypothetical protein GCM10011344_42660 [Dokdonia pacifica]|nr:hypothetical protein GCM10011344_42660 [Dokdonia pacifica]